ncbi:tRNA (adenosine(37)-N6)-dimethylallyltransferase MiaA [Verrucomicrobiota bacterium]
MNHPSSAFFLVGPTGVGKTDVAQEIAERGDFDILSADSMLIYRGMDIGTAKPGVVEQSRVRYWGIDLVSPQEPFSVGMYREVALRAIESVVTSGRKMIVTGGTGLYIKSLIDGLASRGPENKAIRLKGECLLREKGIEPLQEWLKTTDSGLYESLPDKKNARRLIRALEWSSAGGISRGGRWKRGSAGPCIPGLSLPSDQLYERIERRVLEMYSGGLIEEVERLIEQGFDSAPTACQAIGYAEAVSHVKGQCSMDEAVRKTVARTRQLVRRQNTWFRHQANVHWLRCDVSTPIADMAEKVLEYWQAHGPTPIAEA